MSTLFGEHICDRRDICDHMPHRLARVERKLDQVLERLTIMGTTVAQLDAEISVIEGLDTTLAAAVTKAIADLEAKASGSSVDLTAELTRLQNIATALNNVQTAATTADPGAPVATLASTVTTLTTPSLTVTAGASVALTAVVEETPAGAVPTGTVTFLDGTLVLGTSTLDATGTGEVTVPMPAGTHVLTASYGGDAANSASVSSAVTVVAS